LKILFYFNVSQRGNFFTRVFHMCACLVIATAAPAAAQTAAPAAPTLTTQPVNTLSSYRINSGDGIEIYVWGEERLQRSLKVLPDGTIAFPLVGQLQVAGLLPQEVEAMVSERLRGQYRGEVPVVTVSVAETAGLQFSIMGKVRAPGSFTSGRYLNVLEALSLAGGPAEFANLDNITLIREQGGEIVSIRLRLAKLFKPGVSPADVQRAGIVRLLPGDVVIVP
jgi:polysaccharide export outer membrane protein